MAALFYCLFSFDCRFFLDLCDILFKTPSVRGTFMPGFRGFDRRGDIALQHSAIKADILV